MRIFPSLMNAGCPVDFCFVSGIRHGHRGRMQRKVPPFRREATMCNRKAEPTTEDELLGWFPLHSNWYESEDLFRRTSAPTDRMTVEVPYGTSSGLAYPMTELSNIGTLSITRL